MPCRSTSSATRSGRRLDAAMSAGARQPDDRSPAMSASPIFPAPSTAIRRSSTAMPNAMQPGARAVARSVRGRRTHPGRAPGPAEQEDLAGQPLPLAVRREQLGRLPPLDPPSRERRVQLDEREVSDETVVVAAETLGRDHADGPRPDAAFACEPVPHHVGREVVQALEVDRRGEPVQAWMRAAARGRGAGARPARTAVARRG